MKVITSKQAKKAVKEHYFKISKKHNFKKSEIEDAKKFEKENGFRYEDTWNLDHSIACFILPRLIYFRDNNFCIPSIFIPEDYDKEKEDKAMKKWNKILNKMIYAFYLIVIGESVDLKEEEEDEIKKGLDLFRKYYFDLWI